MTMIEIGSHLVTSRTGYTHHGIYIGYDRVIHYSGLSNGLSAGPIKTTTLELFVNGQDLRIRKYNNPKYIGQSVVERAYTRIGEDEYDLQTNNCEHFCTWAVTGYSNSRQVDAAGDFIDIIMPGSSITAALKARKYLKQELDTVEIAKDAAELGIKAAILTSVPAALPAYAAYKAIKWLFK